MADGVLSFPFRLDRSGMVATTVRGSDAEVDEALAVTVLTVTGERPMAPTFGIPDPAFTGVTMADVTAAVRLHGPEGVEVVSVDSTPVDDTTERTTIRWAHNTEVDG